MTPLKEKILRLIALEGPIGVAQYMHLALSDPEHGYYMRGETLKRASPSSAGEVDAAIDRLLSPAQMGTLFKVLGLTSPNGPALPGF